MKSLLLPLLISAVVVAIYATKCMHGDLSGCGGVNCTNPNEELGCDHDVCTCVPKPQACLAIDDCNVVTCEKHDERPHCLDGNCKCQKEHH